MPQFSRQSAERLATCHPDLQDLFEEVVQHFDCTVLCGHRTEEDQDQKYLQGLSRKRWPDSKHNQQPSLAVDVAPYPINWADHGRFRTFGGFVLGVAAARGLSIRWGGDWDQDTQTKDNRFDDLPHFELDREDT